MERLIRIKEEVMSFYTETTTISIHGIKRRLGEFESKYKYLKDNSPHLFDKIVEKQFNPEQFAYMIHCLTNVHDNKISLHDASVKVGAMLVDSYVKPQLEKDK